MLVAIALTTPALLPDYRPTNNFLLKDQKFSVTLWLRGLAGRKEIIDNSPPRSKGCEDIAMVTLLVPSQR